MVLWWRMISNKYIFFSCAILNNLELCRFEEQIVCCMFGSLQAHNVNQSFNKLISCNCDAHIIKQCGGGASFEALLRYPLVKEGV